MILIYTADVSNLTDGHGVSTVHYTGSCTESDSLPPPEGKGKRQKERQKGKAKGCLLYTSDAADE